MNTLPSKVFTLTEPIRLFLQIISSLLLTEIHRSHEGEYNILLIESRIGHNIIHCNNVSVKAIL